MTPLTFQQVIMECAHVHCLPTGPKNVCLMSGRVRRSSKDLLRSSRSSMQSLTTTFLHLSIFSKMLAIKLLTCMVTNHHDCMTHLQICSHLLENHLIVFVSWRPLKLVNGHHFSLYNGLQIMYSCHSACVRRMHKLDMLVKHLLMTFLSMSEP